MERNPQAFKLKKLFDSIIHGNRPLTRPDGPLFIKAICSQADPTSCLSQLVTSKAGVNAVQAAMRFDLSNGAFNGPGKDLLLYFQGAPELTSIGGGVYLHKLLLAIVDPPFFWDAFVASFQSKSLQGQAQLAFAWLLLQLIPLPGVDATFNPYKAVAEAPGNLTALLESSDIDTRVIAQKIKHMLEVAISVDEEYGPGGRHDNDFVNFRHISILPTSDELQSSALPFLRPSSFLEDPENESSRMSMHVDNQYRLLREDMMYGMKDELQIAMKKKKGKHRGLVITGFDAQKMELHCGSEDRRQPWGIALHCLADIPQLKNKKPKDRKAFIDDNRSFLRHQSMSCLLVDEKIVAFPTINRDEELLKKVPPVIILQLEGESSTIKALLKLKSASSIKVIQIDTATFAYEPVLGSLKNMQTVPLASEILFWNKDRDSSLEPLYERLTYFIEALRRDSACDVGSLLQTPKSINLDDSQAASLLSALSQKVSLIQGPPGTGKSFIGALFAKAIHDFTRQTILVVCYTNHALDQFLEDLLDIGIPASSMVRLGGKSTTRTEPLSLYNQKGNVAKWQKSDWTFIKGLEAEIQECHSRLDRMFNSYLGSNISYDDLLDHLQFDDYSFFHSFQLPENNTGMTVVGKKGQAVRPTYLIYQWSQGRDAGVFKKDPQIATSKVWAMTIPDRQAKIHEWNDAIMKEKVLEIYEVANRYNSLVQQHVRKKSENNAAVLKSKRIVACTTTAAAKYAEDIKAAAPNVVLVEEAGEILESHILTAMGPDTTQLCLIGDHKQLRPKVDHYLLTVEKGEGFDLNRSLFERLVLKRYPHQTLNQQHRMRPEISALVRELTYPDLVDAASTKNRPVLRGMQDFLVFISHSVPEDDSEKAESDDAGTLGSTSSKKNSHEASMILKIVRYLAQQGYGTNSMVVLTPYLGQLSTLRNALKQENDPVLNDLDSYDLVRAGLLPSSSAKISKRSIRLATIDNYQGEESDIIIVSLTRSNPEHNIGFMFSPERLNVLLSRARNALIMIGNPDTFINSKKGKELWTKFFGIMRREGHIYDGLPIHCERHPDRTAVLGNPNQFDEKCPDGGCKEPCTTILNCNKHKCPSKCHQLSDHSKMDCEYIMNSKCVNGKHTQTWKCFQKIPLTCSKCEREAKAAEQRRKEAFERQEREEREQAAHAKKLAEIEAEIAREQESIRGQQLSRERADIISQKEKDLEDAKARALNILAPVQSPQPQLQSQPLPIPRPPPSAPMSPSLPAADVTSISEVTDSHENSKPNPAFSVPASSKSKVDWEYQKTMQGSNNDAIDAIMDLVGLEDVKAGVLNIQNKIDVTKRQSTSLKNERFNTVLLGNAGTGKTTVARLYAKFLTTAGALPGDEFVERSGSRLATDGVPEAKKLVEDTITAGGGTIFIDEAYQLTSKHNFQGGQVLDFLLAEMENNVGTLVFILAGYNREMESFFEHNPGLTSRVPIKFQFADYTDGELLEMFQKLVGKRFSNKMKIQDGSSGLSVRIAVRRLAQGRGRPGFGNVRALQNMFAKVLDRQAARLTQERKHGKRPDDFLLVREDLIGPDPSEAIRASSAWNKLQKMIGLGSVKDSIQSLIFSIQTNYKRELKEEKPIETPLNRVFTGNPGTGKTTVAKLYGQILADLALLSNGEVVIKNPSDFIGAALGESEKNTKAILDTTVGKILIIDEAYMLYTGTGGTGNQSDPYKTAVIDTIVAEVQSTIGEDRCVLLLGYKEKMEVMFQNVNPGLARRFRIEDAFQFEDFSDPELLQILDLKLKSQDLDATPEAKSVAIQLLSREKNKPNFGNGGAVENLLSSAKSNFLARQGRLPPGERSSSVVFLPVDVDPQFDRATRASSNLQTLFSDVVGREDVINKLAGYQDTALKMKARGMDARGRIPMNFVFKGPAGTGKTTIARKLGQVFYDMGFLSSTEVVEASTADLVANYVGQTGTKTRELFEKALGKVLFIDEAYRLGEGHFAKEAVDEIVGILTNPKFMNKLVLILAGYDREMDQLLSVNTGLSSRFSETIMFANMSPDQCLEVLAQALQKSQVSLSALEDHSSADYREMKRLISDLSIVGDWGNARDMIKLSNTMVRIAFASDLPADAPLSISGREAIKCINEMLVERRRQANNVQSHVHSSVPSFDLLPPPLSSNPFQYRTTTKTKTADDPVPEEDPVQLLDLAQQRDAGVSDAVWNKLQADKHAEEMAKKIAEETIRRLAQELRDAEEKLRIEVDTAKKLAEQQARDTAEQDELKRKLEEIRMRELVARNERDQRAAELEARRKEEQRQRQEEAKVQAKLRDLGVCVAGFKWIKQAGGYSCAGGAHFIGNAQLGI